MNSHNIAAVMKTFIFQISHYSNNRRGNWPSNAWEIAFFIASTCYAQLEQFKMRILNVPITGKFFKKSVTF